VGRLVKIYMIEESEILAVELKRYSALIGADIEVLEDMFSDDLIYIHSTGSLDSKVSFLNLISTGTIQYKKMDFTNSQVRIFGDVGILTGVGNFIVCVDGVQLNPSIKFHSIWMKKNSILKFISWHATKL